METTIIYKFRTFKMKNHPKNITVFIDESGTLPDPKDKVVVIAAVGTQLSQDLRRLAQKVREKTKIRSGEVKFYRAGERTKTIFLKELAKLEVDLFVLAVEKQGQKIPDTPENFAFLCDLLLKECQIFYGDRIEKIVFDRHFFRKHDQEIFNKYLKQFINPKTQIIHIDSQKNPAVSAADMLAGSFLWQQTGKEERFYQLVKPLVIVEKRINWKEARRRFFQKKFLAEPAQAPIQARMINKSLTKEK